MYTVKSRVYGEATDGRTVLRYTPGMVITDDEAKHAGLVKGKPSESKPARGLTVKSGRTVLTDEVPVRKPVDHNTNLSDLRAICDAESIDPDGANTRAEYVTAIEAARKAG